MSGEKPAPSQHDDVGAALGAGVGTSRTPRPYELRVLACELAREAGALLLERFGDGRNEGVRSKSTPTDLVSEADLASESLLRRRLAESRPADGFLGEEGEDEVGSSGLRWVIDPLDGTVNFLFGIPQWCVSVAVQEVALPATEAIEAAGSSLLDASATLAGSIYDPCRDELWSASVEEPARLGEAVIEGSRRTELATAMVATGLAYDARLRERQARTLASLIPRVRDIRRFGSAALDLAWAATGRYDAYFERGVKLWDIAAGVLICERAGLAVRDLPPAPALPDGPPLPAGVLVSAPELEGELYESVAASGR